MKAFAGRCFRKQQDGLTVVEGVAVLMIVGALVVAAASAVGHARMAGNRVKCASNLRQIGLALGMYASEHNGAYPTSTHTTGSYALEESWIYGIAGYLGNVDDIRVCPADPLPRQKQILTRRATSYVLNELVFDDERYRRVTALPYPGKTLLAVILSENRSPSPTWDHVHSGDWRSWQHVINDVQVDRHLAGQRARLAKDRVKGSANYLYADGHVENLGADVLKKLVDSGRNPAAVPADAHPDPLR